MKQGAIMRDSKEAEYALIEWRNEINNYFNNNFGFDRIILLS